MQLIQIFLVHLTQILYTYPFGAAYTHPFGAILFSAAYSFGRSIQSIWSFDEDSRREYSMCMSDISILLIHIAYVCVVEGSYEECMVEVKFMQHGYMIIC